MTRRLVSALVHARVLSSLAVTIGLLAVAPAAVGAVSEPGDPIIGAGAGSPWSATVRIAETRDTLTGADSQPTVFDKLAWSSVKALELPVDAGQQSVYLEGVAAYTSNLLAYIPGGCSRLIVGQNSGAAIGYNAPQGPELRFRFVPSDQAHPEKGLKGWMIDPPMARWSGPTTTTYAPASICPPTLIEDKGYWIGDTGRYTGGSLAEPGGVLPPPTVTGEADGSIRISGSLTESPGGVVTTGRRIAYDIVCSNPSQCWTGGETVPLSVFAGRLGGGAGTIRGGYGIECGNGRPAGSPAGVPTAPTACEARIPVGARVRLAALPSETSVAGTWFGCDEVVGTSCFVTMNQARHVGNIFSYDFVGQYEPPPDGLFEPARKVEIASDGAEGAQSGAMGCALSVPLLAGAAEAGSVVVVGGAAESSLAGDAKLLEEVLNETVGNCVQGVVSTIANGLLLKVDPPDPAWRRVAFVERMPRPRVAGCPTPLDCAKLLGARRRYVDASTRVVELQEALAVAANRFGNATGQGDRAGQQLHEATMRAVSGMLAEAAGARDRRGSELARALRASGVRSLVVTKRGVQMALTRAAKGRGIPRSAIARLQRKHLVASPRDAVAAIRSQARATRATQMDVLAGLRRTTPTRAMRAAGRALTVADLVSIVTAFHADLGTAEAVRRRHLGLMSSILRCDAGSAAAARALAKDVEKASGLGGEPGKQVAWVARRLAAKKAGLANPACG